jgi:hypothetical protein
MERIVELSSYEVEKYFRQLKSEGSGRETLRYIRIILNRACRLARKWSGNRLPNPIADTELPRYPAGEQPLPVRALIS